MGVYDAPLSLKKSLNTLGTFKKVMIRVYDGPLKQRHFVHLKRKKGMIGMSESVWQLVRPFTVDPVENPMVLEAIYHSHLDLWRRSWRKAKKKKKEKDTHGRICVKYTASRQSLGIARERPTKVGNSYSHPARGSLRRSASKKVGGNVTRGKPSNVGGNSLCAPPDFRKMWSSPSVKYGATSKESRPLGLQRTPSES